MGATYQEFTFNSNSLSSSLSINKPSGAVANDLLIAFLMNTVNVTFTPPTGWTQVGSQTTQGAVFWRTVGSAPGSDGASYSFSVSSSLGNNRGTIVRFSNAHLTAPIDAEYQVTASSANAVMSSLTMPRNDTTLFTFLQLGGATSAVTVPSGMSQNFNVTTGNTHAGASLTGLSAGSTGTKTWTNNATTYVAAMLAIRTGTTAYSQTPSDTATSSDVPAKAVGHPTLDAATTSDAVVKAPNKKPADSVSTADAIAGKVLGVGKADAADAFEAQAKALGTPRADSIISSDASVRLIGQNPSDSATPSDVRRFDALKGIAETATAVEDITLILGLLRSIGEVSEPVDQIGKAFGMGTQTASVVAAEAAALLVQLNPTDALSTADAAATLVAWLRGASDLVAASEAPSKHITLAFADAIGAVSDWPVSVPTRTISGLVVNHETGEPVAGATMRLFRTHDDAYIGSALSDEVGAYAFERDESDPYTYYVTADYNAGVPVHGVTDRGLVPEVA